MKPVSKSFYLIWIIVALFGSFILAFLGGIGLAFYWRSGRIIPVLIFAWLICFAIFLAVYGVVLGSIVIYRMWKCILDGKVRTTPGKAVGFLFIPFFNLYWSFQALWGWTKDYNQYISQCNISVPRMPEGLAVATCITLLASIIPCIGPLFTFVYYILFIIFLNYAIDGLNALIAAGTSREEIDPH